MDRESAEITDSRHGQGVLVSSDKTERDREERDGEEIDSEEGSREETGR